MFTIFYTEDYKKNKMKIVVSLKDLHTVNLNDTANYSLNVRFNISFHWNIVS